MSFGSRPTDGDERRAGRSSGAATRSTIDLAGDFLRLAAIYDSLALDARKRAAMALGRVPKKPEPLAYHSLRAKIGRDLYAGVRLVRAGLATSECLRYEAWLNAGMMTESELP